MTSRDQASYNNYMRSYMQRRYRERIEEMRKRLGGVCARCGSSQNLEFDHIDPSEKLFNLSSLMSVSRAKLEGELAKCQLLCHSCHVLKSIKDAGKKSAIGTHGTLSSYRYCKCDLCRQAKSESNRAQRLRRRA